VRTVKSITLPKPPSELQLGDTFDISFEGNDSEVKYTVKKIVNECPSLGNAPQLTTRYPKSE